MRQMLKVLALATCALIALPAVAAETIGLTFAPA